MKLILSTSNIIGGSSPIRRDPTQKSNVELISSLRANFAAHARALTNGFPNGDGTAAEVPPSSDPTSTAAWDTDPFPLKASYTAWTHMADDGRRELEIPALGFAQSGLQEEREQYDITLKLFYLPGAPRGNRATQTREAVKLVLKELHMPSLDLLIVSFPGVYFDEEQDCPDKLSTRGPVEAEPEALESQLETWKTVEALHDEGIVQRIGVAELGHERLKAFLDAARLAPSVDQINLRDCCSVPRNLLTLAKTRGVELLVHNDSANVLPRGAVRELLGGPVGVLAEASTTGAKRKSLHGEGVENMAAQASAGEVLQGEVQPLWVVKYTAVVKNRGVVENKGYFAAAELTD